MPRKNTGQGNNVPTASTHCVAVGARTHRIARGYRPDEAPDCGRGRSVSANSAESPLGWLMSRGRISERQFIAGDRLRQDWTRAGLAPRVTMRWDAVSHIRRQGPTQHDDPTVAQIMARRRFDDAIGHAGAGLADILWRVVCAGEGMEIAEDALGWPKRAGKVVLGLALDRIADFYGLGEV